MKLIHLLVLVTTTFMSGLLVAAPSNDNTEEWIYSVRPGDTIWSICAQYIQEPQCWQKVGPYNGIDLPRQLPPGSVLKIPVAWLKNPPAPVLVKELKGEVFWQKSGSEQRLKLNLNDQLNKGDTVITEQGQLLLEFADGALMQVEKHTRIVFDRLRYVRGSKSLVDTYLRLNRGAAQTQITPGRHQYKFQIETPAGIAAVRGTQFRTQLSEASNDNSLMTEVLRGRVAVSQDQQEVAVDAGFGLVSTAGEALAEPEKLLPPVQIKTAALQAAPVDLQWAKLDAAQAYRVKVNLRGEKTSLQDQLLNTQQLQLAELADGQYQLQIQALAASGLQGELAEFDFVVATPLTTASIDKAKLNSKGRLLIDFKAVENAATYQLEYATDKEFSAPTRVVLKQTMAQLQLDESLSGQSIFVRLRAISSNHNQAQWSDVMEVKPQTGINWLAYAHIALAFSIFLL